MTTHLLDLNNTHQLKIFRRGTGPEIIILHGWTGAAEDWKPIVDRLEKDATLLTYNARPYFTRDASIEMMAQDLDLIIREKCHSRPILMGHSMGALVAWEYIKTYGQDALSGMIIVDMTPCMIERPDWKLSLYRGYSSADNQDFISKLKHDFVSTVCDLIVSGKVLSESERLQVVNQEMMKIRKNRIAKLDPEAWITCWESFVHKDYRSVLSGITLPSLLTYGEKSNFYGPEIAHYVHQNIAGSRLVMFEGAGHSPQMEQPDRFAGEIQCFLKDHFS